MAKPTTFPIPKGANGESVVVHSGRGANGRFVKGCKGGPGTPYGKRINELRKALYARISQEDIGDILDSMIKCAKDGDVSAAKLVLGYVVQQPAILEGNEDDTTISVVARIPRSQAIDLMSKN